MVNHLWVFFVSNSKSKLDFRFHLKLKCTIRHFRLVMKFSWLRSWSVDAVTDYVDGIKIIVGSSKIKLAQPWAAWTERASRASGYRRPTKKRLSRRQLWRNVFRIMISLKSSAPYQCHKPVYYPPGITAWRTPGRHFAHQEVISSIPISPSRSANPLQVSITAKFVPSGSSRFTEVYFFHQFTMLNIWIWTKCCGKTSEAWTKLSWCKIRIFFRCNGFE